MIVNMSPRICSSKFLCEVYGEVYVEIYFVYKKISYSNASKCYIFSDKFLRDEASGELYFLF